MRLNYAPASKLITFFELTGQLEVRPINPATGKPYTLAPGESEMLFYETAEDFKTYSWRVGPSAEGANPL